MKTIPINADPLTLTSLRGRSVLITGGASGIGRDLAIACVKAGATVIVGDLNVDGLMGTQRLCQDVQGKGVGKCVPFLEPCDVTSPAKQSELFKFAAKQLEGSVPDVVVANAGVNELGDYLKVKEKVNDLGTFPAEPRMPTIDINLQSVCVTAALAEAAWAEHPLESSSNAGRRRKLVVIASMAGLSGLPVAPTYGCAKHGVIGLWLATCDKLQKLGEDRGFDCHAVCPFFALDPKFLNPIQLLTRSLAVTPLLDPMTGIVLAGLPLVLSSTIASGIAQIAAGVQSSGVGSVLALPDHEAPLVIPFDEFEHLGKGMYERIETTLRDRQPDYKKAPWNTALRRDVLKALGLDKPVNAMIAGGAVSARSDVMRNFAAEIWVQTAAAIGLTTYASLAMSSSKLLGWGVFAGGLLRLVR